MRRGRHQARWAMMAGATILCCALAAAAFGASGLDEAISLYQEARYAEALDVLNRLADPAGSQATGSQDARQVAEYQALCLLALDRADDARAVVRKLLEGQPNYQPQSARFPPRYLALVQDTRVAALPDLVRTEYRLGKARYDEKSYRLAEAHLRKVVALLDDETVPAATRQSLTDLRELAEGFLALIPDPTAPPLPSVAAVPPPEPLAGGAAAPPEFYTAADAGVRPPIAVKQDVPAWRTGFEDLRRTASAGTLELVVDESGRVASARMTAPVDPLYDTRLLAATRNWRFRPALKDGRPVKYKKVMAVHVTEPGDH